MTTTTIEPTSATLSSDGALGRRLRWLWRGSADDPSWYRPLLLALLAATAIAYIVDLTASDYANSFYAAAVQAGTKSWKAFLFGSLDASNFITVDKPPAFLWVMDLSGRIFGFSSASMLIPQVLEGVISAALLSATVKRWYGAGAGLIAALVMVITPVAALMFRFNNPDALMVCLMVASAYCLTRALEGASTKWMLGVGACLGFAFLAKMMEAFLVLPGFALVYMVAAPTSFKRRSFQTLAGGAAIVVCSGWWVALDELWPKGSRPFVDGSPDNSILNLIFGYNGIGRLDGSEGMGGGGHGGFAAGGTLRKLLEEQFGGRTGAGGAGAGGHGGFGGGGSPFGGSATITRMFSDQFGAQASWLILAAVVILAGGLIWRGRRARTDRFRAGLILWGSWLVVSGLVFSFSTGIIHTYYTVELVPAIAALVAIGVTALWRQRDSRVARAMLAALIAITAAWSVILLQRDSSWQSWLTPLVIVTAALAIIGLLLPSRLWKRAALATAVVGAIGCLAAPLAYTADTLSTAHTGSTPTAGPDQSSGFGGGGFAKRLGLSTGRGGFPGFGGSGTGSRSAGGLGRGGFGGMGETKVSSALVKLLEESKGYRWAAITDGSQSAASLELASDGAPVAAIGGFDGQGGLITLAQFEKYVKAGDIHYYIVSSGFGGGGGFGGATSGTSTTGGAPGGTGGAPSGTAGTGGAPGASGGSSSTSGAPGAATGSSGTSGSGLGSLFSSSSSSSTTDGSGATSTLRGLSAGGGFGRSSGSESKIEAWVKAHYTAQTVGGETIYNLSQPKS